MIVESEMLPSVADMLQYPLDTAVAEPDASLTAATYVSVAMYPALCNAFGFYSVRSMTCG